MMAKKKGIRYLLDDGDEDAYVTMKVKKDLHMKLKALYPVLGYKLLQDFTNEGLEYWVKFVKELLKKKKEKEGN